MEEKGHLSFGRHGSCEQCFAGTGRSDQGERLGVFARPTGDTFRMFQEIDYLLKLRSGLINSSHVGECHARSCGLVVDFGAALTEVERPSHGLPGPPGSIARKKAAERDSSGSGRSR
jgi:hypothetical protein